MFVLLLCGTALFFNTRSSAQELHKHSNSTEQYEHRVKNLLQQGIDACTQGMYQQALPHFKELLAIQPPPKATLRAYVYQWLGTAYCNLNDSLAAFEALRYAASLGYDEWQEIEHLLANHALSAAPQAQQIVATMKHNATVMKVYDVETWNNPEIPLTILFSFGEYDSPAYRKLRLQYQLTELIKDKKTESEQHLSVMNWVHNLWAHSIYGIAKNCTALAILEETKKPNFTGFRCIEYCVVLCESLQALGFPARTVEIGRDGLSYGIGKSHFVVEVWNNNLRKWVLLDPQNNLIWVEQSSDVPLNAAEIREHCFAAMNDSNSTINTTSATGTIRIAKTPKTPALRFALGASQWRNPAIFNSTEWLEYFHHLLYPLDDRSFTTSLDMLPKINLLAPRQKPELAYQHGTRELQITRRVGQVYPVLNRVHIDIKPATHTNTTTPSEILDVVFTNSMPWFDHYAIECNGVAVTHKSNTYSWHLVKGANTLVVWGVNQAGITGVHSRIVLTYYGQP